MIIKLAINIPLSHLHGDTKELNSMKKNAKGILYTIKDMQTEDREAMNKNASIFNHPKAMQTKQAVSSFTPKHLASSVKAFHPASTSSNKHLIANAKQEATSGTPKTKWWAKMEKAQLN
jgi:hypothetical protein